MHELAVPQSMPERKEQDPREVFEDVVRLLQQVRESVLMHQGLIDTYLLIQAEDEARHARQGSRGAMSRNGYEALTRLTEERLQSLLQDQARLEEHVHALRKTLFN